MRRIAIAVLVAAFLLVVPGSKLDFPPHTPIALADPALSGAITTDVVNGDFSGEGLGEVGTPPTNHDFETSAGAVGTPPANHDFETGALAPEWSVVTGSPTVQSGGPTGYYAQLTGLNTEILSSSFNVPFNAQKLHLTVATVSASSVSFRVILNGGTPITFSTCPTACTNWNTYTVNAVPYQGTSVTIAIRRLAGDIKVDNVGTMEETLSGWSPVAGDKVSRETGGPSGAYAKATGTALTSEAYTVSPDAQNGELDLKVDSATGTYDVYVLSGATFSTSTKVFSGTQANSSTWATRTFGIGDFAGQTVKFKIVPSSGATVSVDKAAISRNVVPGWATGGEGITVVGGSGGVGYLSNVQTATSATMGLSLSSRKGSLYGAWFRILYVMKENWNAAHTDDLGSTLRVYFTSIPPSPFLTRVADAEATPTETVRPANVVQEDYFFVYNPSNASVPSFTTGQIKILGWPPPGTTNRQSPDVLLIERVDGPPSKTLGNPGVTGRGSFPPRNGVPSC